MGWIALATNLGWIAPATNLGWIALGKLGLDSPKHKLGLASPVGTNLGWIALNTNLDTDKVYCS